MRIEVYRDSAGEWRWRLVTVDGRHMGWSQYGYATEADAKRSAEAFQDVSKRDSA